MSENISLTLYDTPNLLDNIIFIDIIPRDKLDKLLYCNKTMNHKDGIRLMRMLSNCKKNMIGNSLNVSYKFSSKNKHTLKYGRVYPTKGLGYIFMPRFIRHTLMEDKYVDIDIVNCHPSILLQLCQKEKIECSCLELYCKDRNNYIKFYSEKYNTKSDNIKDLFRRLLMLGSFDAWKKDFHIFSACTQDTFLTNFIKELENIHQITNEKNKSKGLNSEYLKETSILSLVLQDIERKILEVVYFFLLDKKVIVNNACSLCYDGIMIEKKYYYDSLLTELSEHIFKSTGLKIEFKCKLPDESISDELNTIINTDNLDLSKINYIELTEFGNSYSPQKMQQIFDEDIAFLEENQLSNLFEQDIQIFNCYKYFNHFHVVLTSGDIYELLPENEVKPIIISKTTFAAMKSKYGPKVHQFYKFDDLLYSCKHLKKYKGLIFDPNLSRADPESFNLFRGFHLSTNDNITYDESIVKTYLDHIHYIIDNTVVENYLLDIFASIIQKPYIRPGIMIIIQSYVEGVGKDIILDIFVKILGCYGKTVASMDELHENFNFSLFGKLFVKIEEIHATSKTDFEQLKTTITRLHESFNIKYKEKIDKVLDFKTYGGSSNQNQCIRPSATDRRFLLIESKATKKERSYYDNLYNIRDDQTKLKHLFNFFSQRIITADFSDVPITDYKLESIIHNLSADIKFIQNYYHILSDPDYETDNFGNVKWLSQCKYISSNELNSFKLNNFSWLGSILYEMIINYANSNSLPRNFSRQMIYKNIELLFPNSRIEKNHKSVAFKFPINVDIDKVIFNYIKASR